MGLLNYLIWLQVCHAFSASLMPVACHAHLFDTIECTCSSFGIDVFTSVCNFLRVPEYIFPKFGKLCSQSTSQYTKQHTQ